MNTKGHTTAVTVSEDWLQYPLVKEAIKRSGAEGLDGITVLSHLQEILTKIEDRCPDVDYQSLFESQRIEDQPTLNKIGANMRALGCGDELVAELTNGRVIQYGAQLYNTRKEKQERVRELVAGGMSINQAAIEVGVGWQTANRYLTKDLQSPGRDGGRQNEIGSYAETHGYKAAMQHFGCSKAHVLNCRKKVRDGIHPTVAWRQNQKGSAA